MARKSRIARSADAALAIVAERRNRTRLERDDQQRYYDRLRAELTTQRGLI
ncbi:hypothetical protein [Agrococcus carbonis]|jgi:hypothetical protein|uniref:Uncharacterized protein n=1 Tax=Agrococcus carbonis TaxID=684552 RepID=A0A1H1Q436_9MICO|nr:hypothetical protein [Agrococcus carbonis]SDS18017.1 hypothetical protein SAMN04489719_1725 [Agrococcus carbonis]